MMHPVLVKQIFQNHRFSNARYISPDDEGIEKMMTGNTTVN